MENKKLKSCPFCGEIPNVIYEEDWDEFFIRCENEQCTITPRTYCYDTVEECRTEWNKRGAGREAVKK